MQRSRTVGSMGACCVLAQWCVVVCPTTVTTHSNAKVPKLPHSLPMQGAVQCALGQLHLG